MSLQFREELRATVNWSPGPVPSRLNPKALQTVFNFGPTATTLRHLTIGMASGRQTPSILRLPVMFQADAGVAASCKARCAVFLR
jgi:hypothetical protein